MRVRFALVIAGILTMGYASAGALTDPDLAPAGVLSFLAGVLILHDIVWMPALLVVGAVITRLVHRRRRPVVITATISAAGLVVVAFPLVLGFGRPADNPSALPSPYGRNLAVLILVLTVVAVLWRRRADDRKDSERPASDDPGSGDG